jgi:hypothetical protein
MAKRWVVAALGAAGVMGASATAYAQDAAPKPLYVDETPTPAPPPRAVQAPPAASPPPAAPAPAPASGARFADTGEAPFADPKLLRKWRSGDEVPDGYHVEKRMRVGLAIAGAATFGGFYLPSAFIAAVGGMRVSGDNELAALWVPVAGPFILMGQPKMEGAAPFLLVDGLGQLAGATMLVFGLFGEKDVLVRTERATLRVTPAAAGAGVGLSGTF